MRAPDQARSKPPRRRVLAVPLALCAIVALLCATPASSAAEQSAPVAIGGSEQGTTVPIGPPAASTAPQAKTTPAPTTPAPAGTTPTRAGGGKAPAPQTPRARTPQVQSQHAQGSSPSGQRGARESVGKRKARERKAREEAEAPGAGE